MRLLPVLLLLACTPKGDAVDPNLDSDGDGLKDVEETELGSDPFNEDSDGDGYLDPWEVAEGSDPTDEASLIYAGGWPYNPAKDDIVDPGFEGSSRRGETVPRFVLKDQFNDDVDIYDFAFQGKPIIIDLSGEWCYYCNEIAKMIEGKRSFFDDYAETTPWVEGLGPLIEDGSIYWLTVLDADWTSYDSAITQEEAVEWYDAYPVEQIPVLADVDLEVRTWIDPAGWPTLLYVNEDMTIQLHPSDYSKVLDRVMEDFPAE